MNGANQKGMVVLTSFAQFDQKNMTLASYKTESLLFCRIVIQINITFQLYLVILELQSSNVTLECNKICLSIQRVFVFR